MVPFFKSHQKEGWTQGIFEKNTAYGIKKKCAHPARFQFAIWGQLAALTLRGHLLLFLRGEGLSIQGTPLTFPVASWVWGLCGPLRGGTRNRGRFTREGTRPPSPELCVWPQAGREALLKTNPRH